MNAESGKICLQVVYRARHVYLLIWRFCECAVLCVFFDFVSVTWIKSTHMDPQWGCSTLSLCNTEALVSLFRMWKYLLGANLRSNLWVPPWKLFSFPAPSSSSVREMDHTMPAAVPPTPTDPCRATLTPPQTLQRHIWAHTLVNVAASCWPKRELE